MPPKKKGKKKSKEELEAERKAREEEEERARQAELQRLEEERIAREEAERKAKEEADRLRAEELARLAEESGEEEVFRLRRAARLRHNLERLQEEEEWVRFRECSRRPNAAVESELNTYITECGEEEEKDISDGLAACQRTEEIVGDLNSELARAQETGDQETIERCLEARRRLRNLSVEKVDRVTANTLENAYELSTELKEGVRETKVFHSCPAAKLGIWVNLTPKGGRMRSVQYPELGMQVDVPKPIATQMIAVRILHVPYDHAASTAAYVTRLASLVEAGAGAGAGAGGAGKRAGSKSRRRRASITGPLEEVKDEEDAENTPQLPPSALMVLGGTFFVELLGLPNSAKRVKNWTMRQETPLSATVHRQPHPMAGQAISVAAAQALKIRVTMSPNVILPKELSVKAWDVEEENWSDAGVTEHHFDEATRVLTVHTINLSALGVIQPRTVDFPYKAWRVEPIAADRSVLKLETQRFSIQIEVSANQCLLLEPALPELEHLHRKPLHPGQLLMELAKCGLDIRPVDGDHAFLPSDAGVSPKDSSSATSFYADVSQLGSAFSIAGSRWNQSSGSTAAVLRVKETLEYDVPEKDIHETDWRTVLYVNDAEAPHGLRCGLLRVTESSKEYASGLAPSEEFHNNIRRTITSRSTPEAMEMVEESDPVFQQTLQHLLTLIKPLSFS